MSDNPWVKFYSSDWLAGTSGLSAAERGVYITLVALIYEFDGPIRRDDGRLARRCGCAKPTFTKILDALIDEGKLSEIGGDLTNSACEREIAARKILKENAISRATKRWDAEREKTLEKQWPSNASASSQHMLDGCEPEPEPERKKKETSVSQKESRASHGSRLAENWALPDDWRAWAEGQGLASQAVAAEADKFRDYWHAVPGQRGRKADWLATWRNWTRKAIADQRPSRGGGRKDDRFTNALHDAERARNGSTGGPGADHGNGASGTQPLLPAGRDRGGIPGEDGAVARGAGQLPGRGDRAGNDRMGADLFKTPDTGRNREDSESVHGAHTFRRAAPFGRR